MTKIRDKRMDNLNRLSKLCILSLLIIPLAGMARIGYSFANAPDENLYPPPIELYAGEDSYVRNEVLVRFAEGSDACSVLIRNGLDSASPERVHSISPPVSRFKKDCKLDRDSKGWYSFLGKRYESVDSIPDEDLFREAYNSMPEEARRVYRTYKITLPDDVSVRDALVKLRDDPAVEFAEPNYRIKAFLVPDDPLYQQQWPLAEIHAEAAWDIEMGDPGVIIAIIDTGIDYNHDDLTENIWNNTDEIAGNGRDDDGNGYIDDIHGYDFVNDDPDSLDDHGHGTHVAGIAAARGDNGIGITGVAPYASLMALKVMDASGEGDVDDAVKAIIYAADAGARILNNSWGTSEYSQTLQDAIDYAALPEYGCFIVAAAGNDSSSRAHYPASNDHVFSVAATAPNGNVFSVTSFGAFVDIAAPGFDILSTLPAYMTAGEYGRMSGTSMASPHIAGQAALLLSLNPKLDPLELENIIKLSSSRKIASNEYIGAGEIDLVASLDVEFAAPVLAVISSPEYNSVVTKDTHSVPITGSATGDSYRIYYSSSANPYDDSSDRLIASSRRKIHNGTLANFDISLLKNGPYFIKLVVEDEYGHRLRHATKILIDHFLAAGWPRQTAEHDLLIESAALGDINGDGSLELVTGSGWGYSPGTVHIWNYDGTDFSGWEGGKKTGGPIIAAPALADLDPAYPGLEIIVASHDWQVYAWHADGTNVEGWPRHSYGSRYFGQFGITPAVGDFDSNNSNGLEVIAPSNYGFIYTWHADGSNLEGWPLFSYGGNGPSAAPVIADVNPDMADGLELVFVRNKLSSGPELVVLRADGTNAGGWPKTIGEKGNDTYTSPAVNDIDPAYDGAEIVAAVNTGRGGTAGLRSVVYMFHSDGTNARGWPINVSSVFDSAAAVADVDLNGDMEIFLAGRDSSVYAWHHDGTVVKGWPCGPVNRGALYDFLSSPVIVDLDGNPDNGLEVVIGSANGRMYAWHSDGSPVDEFPLVCSNGIWSSAVVADMNNDGNAEVAVGSGDGKVYVWSVPSAGSDISAWPTYKNNNMRTGASQAPRIYAVSPDTARVDDRFTIQGRNLNGPNLRILLSNSAANKAAHVLMGYPGELICTVPSLPEGEYELQAVTDFGASNTVPFKIKVNTVIGRVVDSVTGKGIPGASLILKPVVYGYGLRDYSIRTDKTGYFSIKNIKGYIYTSGSAKYWADYTLNVSYPGYKPYKSATINFKDRIEHQFSIVLGRQYPPKILSVNPRFVRRNTCLIINGRDFGQFAPSESKVQFLNWRGALCGEAVIRGWSECKVECAVPKLPSAGYYYVRLVRGDKAVSNNFSVYNF